MIRRALVGLGASLAISAAGVRVRALTAGGAVAALAVGAAVTAGTSWRGAAVLGAFFAPSSLLSRVAKANELGAKTGRRNAAQVLANGGVAALAALTSVWLGQPRALVIASGALAAAAADTWATELGSLSTAPPRMLFSWSVAPRGASGAITALGLAASVGGALSVGGIAAMATPATGHRVRLLTKVAAAGVVGALLDSALGATVQERRWCSICAEPTEAIWHTCGTATTVIGGVAGVNNDVVNLLCTLSGAALTGLLTYRQPALPVARTTVKALLI